MLKQQWPWVTKEQASAKASGSPDTDMDSDPHDLSKVMLFIIKSEQTVLAKVESSITPTPLTVRTEAYSPHRRMGRRPDPS